MTRYLEQIGGCTLGAITASMLTLASAAFGAETKATYSYSCQGGDFVGNSPMPVCSASFQFTADCIGEDMVYKWKIAGTPTFSGLDKSWHVTPWERQWIHIIGAELTNMYDVHQGWWMIGSNWIPDAILFMGRGETHAQKMLPAGAGFDFPPGPNNEPRAYLDLHGFCPKGESASVMMTIYYSVPATPIAPATPSQ
jgi:hypothetical protein